MEQVTAQETLTITPGAALRLTNIAFDEKPLNASTRTTLQLRFTRRGATTVSTAVIGSLVTGRIENLKCSIVLSKGDSYSFEVFGGNTLHLLGYFEDASSEEINSTKAERKPAAKKVKHPVPSSNAEAGPSSKRSKQIPAKRTREDASSSSDDDGTPQPPKARAKERASRTKKGSISTQGESDEEAAAASTSGDNLKKGKKKRIET
ncbi:hypothetical protein NLJ89_g11837 [Agrocybe chaxingu]|uniref:Nucleoplasmin-like domain-containing protein n=1 Tax=Agrocybe chaxingu TaxID=84603 RepID=A0A9W8JN03_9AGAR|nr:hypothetical protein NLJ89_g11837 [Agrocybe chaxingu]